MPSIIIAAICNSICQIIPHSNAQVPSGVIILDKIPHLLGNKSGIFLSEVHLTRWFEKIVRIELKYRNIGIISTTFPSDKKTLSIKNIFHRIIKYREN